MVPGQLVEDTACFKAIDNTSDCGSRTRKSLPASGQRQQALGSRWAGGLSEDGKICLPDFPGVKDRTFASTGRRFLRRDTKIATGEAGVLMMRLVVIEPFKSVPGFL